MGQYYTALVIDSDNKISKLNPGDYGFRIRMKLMEHSRIGDRFANAAYALIYHKPCKVAWIGDYSISTINPNDMFCPEALTRKEFREMYEIAWGDTPSLTMKDFDLAQMNIVDFDTRGMFLVDHDLKCYINMEEFIEKSVIQSEMWRMCASPLPLLTACGNGCGGGDFLRGTGYEDIGTWAFHRIEYTDKVPEGYTKKDCCFIDDLSRESV
jgi:hypothetical protein